MIVERFMGGGFVIGVLLGIVSLVQVIADGDAVRPILFLTIYAILGIGVGWLVGNAVAWLLGVD